MLPFPGTLRVSGCYDSQHCIVPSVCGIVGQNFAWSHSHFIYRSRFAKAARVDDFNFRDIYSPERERRLNIVLKGYIWTRMTHLLWQQNLDCPQNQRSMINDQRSTANGQWSMTNDQWSMIDEKRTFATGQDPGGRITLDFVTVTWCFRGEIIEM